MADLRVEDVRISEQFNAVLLQLGVLMPLDHNPNEPGEAVDARGVRVFQVDPDGILPDEVVYDIATMIIMAVNTCGSFKAVAKQETSRAL